MKAEQLKMARVAASLGVRELAEEASVSPATITRFETGKGGMQMASVDAIRKALEARGIQFMDNGEVAGGPGAAIKRAD